MSDAKPEYTQVRYETPQPGIARIVLDRPDKANAQGVVMTYEIDEAFKRASQDDDIRVIILAGEGKHFCAGHDLSGEGPTMPDSDRVTSLWGQFRAKGWAGYYAREKEIYLEITDRWRNCPKPTIAEVQGVCIAGGLMLAWACDLIVCSDDARFRDNTASEMGIPGVEFFQHPFELGVRKAKEWLLTGDWMEAAEAERRGMVNHVVPRAELSARTLELAAKIADKNPFTNKLVKEAMNQSQDLMGRRVAMNAAFSLHQIAHMQSMLVSGFPVDISRLHPSVRARLEAARDRGRGGPPAIG
jgi:enoyl-CoA hydratase